MLIGPPGVGTSHIATAIAVGAIPCPPRPRFSIAFWRAVIVQMTGKSYRLRQRASGAEWTLPAPTAHSSGAVTQDTNPPALARVHCYAILAVPADWPVFKRSVVAAFHRSVTRMTVAWWRSGCVDGRTVARSQIQVAQGDFVRFLTETAFVQ